MGSAFVRDSGALREGPCPCGVGTDYAGCCGRLHRGEALARTAAELMRSRYSAFAVGDADYLLLTWHPSTRPAAFGLDTTHTWTGLEVIDTDCGGPQDTEGTVTYRASSRSAGGRAGSFVERARFARRGRRWVYVDGVIDPAAR